VYFCARGVVADYF
nr:immunoglobulin heavy chain junction region [Mus musculus]